MVPEAPGRKSGTNAWRRREASLSPSTRCSASSAPPAGEDSTTLTGRSGQPAAASSPAANAVSEWQAASNSPQRNDLSKDSPASRRRAGAILRRRRRGNVRHCHAGAKQLEAFLGGARGQREALFVGQRQTGIRD